MRWMAILTGVAMMAACSQGTDEGTGTLSGLGVSDGEVSGTWTGADGTVDFSSTLVEDGVFDIVVTVNGMMLSAIIDRDGQVAEIDGFGMDTGADTQILENDREALTAALHQIETDVSDSPAGDTLVRVLGNWAQTPDTVSLQRTVMGEENRSYTSICWAYHSYQYATHDDWSHDRWDSKSTSLAHVGYRTGSTYSYYNSAWRTSEPDHVSYVQQYGECYGNCGGGCPGGGQQLTWDCHDHDQCVRDGHSLASFWCDDEFTSASDDELFAPSCSGT